ncbi:hypothetical protein ACH4E8_19480 [Streptomyces sp. NPDC017979]|uniref:hypothetical protein n=1 Tax=Streptomyces sp. NPDC017979 TaxID=3365024 RepID=UPI0037A07B9A
MTRATDEWGQWQKHNARGMSGAEGLRRELDRIVRAGGIASPVTTTRGLSARLRYLDSPAGKAELKRQGVTPRLLRAWGRGGTPSAAKLAAVDTAYWNRRRENVIKSGALLRILNNEGRGRRIEIYPVDQTHVAQEYRRDLSDRSIQGRYIWDDLVKAWVEGDAETMEDIWDDVIAELDSDYGAYAYVGAVTIGA